METLPSELQSIIISLLDDKTRRIFRLANTQWFNRIRYDDFTFNFTTNEQLPLIFQRLQRYEFPIGIKFQKSKCAWTKQNFEMLGQLTQLTKFKSKELTFEEDEIPVADLLSKLTNLELLSEGFPPKLNRRLFNLKKFKLSYYQEEDISLSNFSKLEVITFQHIDNPLSQVPHTQHITRINIAAEEMDSANLLKYPRLKQLTFMGDTKNPNGTDFPYLPNMESLILRAPSTSLYQLERLTSLTWRTINIDFASLARLTKLRRLELSSPTSHTLGVNGWQFLTALPNLEMLELHLSSWPDVGEILQFVPSKKMSKLLLKSACASNRITKFSNLQSLALSRFLTPAATELETLSNLTCLTAAQVRAEMFPSIEKLTNLKVLDLRDVGLGPTDKDILHIEKLNALEELTYCALHYFQYSPISDEAVQHLPLKKLITWWPIHEPFLKNIAKVTTLEHLELTQTEDLSDDAILHLTSLTNLTYLKMSGCTMTGVNLALLSSLQTIYVNASEPGKLMVDSNLLKNLMPRLYQCQTFPE
jgi:hypothetical protein